ncbi:MAG: PAS domain-containing protein [Planctomycetes bacterium]|nr:PAS domain-containing protein [Planctomycetota bacterium]
MRWRRSENRDGEAAAGTVCLRRGELLASFGILIVTIIVAALAITVLVQGHLLQRQMRSRVSEAAPAMMKLLAQTVRQNISAPVAELQRLADDLTLISSVQHCRIYQAQPPVTDALGPSPPSGASATTPNQRPPAVATASAADPKQVLLELHTDIRDENGVELGALEIGFGVASVTPPAGMLWSAAGLVAVAALILFALSYRAAQGRIRPIAFIRDNLLAYHNGSETALELLAVQDQSGQVTRAWNGLVNLVRDMQREVDVFRCQHAIADSPRVAHSHSAHTLLDHMPIGVLRIDAENRLVYANRSATRLLALRTGDDDGARILAERVPDARLAESIVGLRSVAEQAGGVGTDYRIAHGPHHTIVRLSPVAPAGDAEDELVVLVQDISQLKEAQRSRDEFLAHITHELRTPLTNIRAYTETLTDDFFDDEQTRRECYNVIMGETRRLSQLIEDVLSVSQIEAGVARLNQTQVRVDQSLRQVVQDIQAAADSKSLELSLKIPSKVPTIPGDAHRLHQVWTNLIGNAVKYTPKGGSVGVEVQADERVLRVRVSDTGIGIAPECHEQIFEKFYRVDDPAVEAEVGSGLGLAIVRDIVRMHGGFVRVESEATMGATFIVELPLQSEASASETPEVADGPDRDR